MPDPKRLEFSYRESPAYRTVSVQGAYGGLTPRGDIFLGVYSERTHFPDTSILEIGPQGELGPEKFRITQGVVREVQVGLMMDLNTAKSLQDWLKTHIETLEAALKAQKDSK
jgi:hypothetical protein